MTTNYESSSACCEEPFHHLSVKASLSGHLFLRGPQGSPLYDHGAPLVSSFEDNDLMELANNGPGGLTRFLVFFQRKLLKAVLQNSPGWYCCMLQPLVCGHTEKLSLRLTWWFLGTESGRSLYCHVLAAGLAPDGHLCLRVHINELFLL